MMWKRYKYIYYWLYSWNRDMWKDKSDLPEFNAVVGMSLSFLSVLFSIFSLIYIFTDIKILPENISKTKLIIPLLAVLAFHYFALMHKGKFRRIEEEFMNETSKERRRKGRWVLLYAFGSIVFYIVLLFFGIWMKN